MSDEKRIREDINGRLHSLDQGLRSVEKRLRAVERRLSGGDASGGELEQYEADLERELEETREGITAITQELEDLKSSTATSEELDTELQHLRQQVTELSQSLQGLKEENAGLKDLLSEDKKQNTEQSSEELKTEIAQLRERLEKAEKRNRINIGSMQVPMEMSGIIGALILLATGGLIMAGRWDIIRSPYFSFAIAFIFAVAVLMKFYLANHSRA